MTNHPNFSKTSGFSGTRPFRSKARKVPGNHDKLVTLTKQSIHKLKWLSTSLKCLESETSMWTTYNIFHWITKVYLWVCLLTVKDKTSGKKKISSILSWSFDTLPCSWWKASLFPHFPTLLSFLTFSLLFLFARALEGALKLGSVGWGYTWCSDPAFSSLPNLSNLLNEVHPVILLNFTHFSYVFYFVCFPSVIF